MKYRAKEYQNGEDYSSREYDIPDGLDTPDGVSAAHHLGSLWHSAEFYSSRKLVRFRPGAARLYVLDVVE